MTNEKLTKLADEVYKALKQTGKTLSTAESCTGGMIGQYLTAVPGISDYYGYGFITYSNQAKITLLGVNGETLKNYGAVSSETVCEMAEGALKVSGADIAVSVSGIAGPGGGTKEKPVGLVYVGCAKKGGNTFFEKLNLTGDRQSVREQTVCRVFEIVLKNINM